LRLEVETLKQQQQRPVEPVAAPQEDPLDSRRLTTLERMRRGEQVGGGPPRLPAISGIPEHALQPVRLTPPRVEPRVETLAQPRPVIPPAETEKKAFATSCSQFNDERIQANVERIQAEARRNAPKSQVEAIEVEVTDERDVEEQDR